jgi:hypothetical protein
VVLVKDIPGRLVRGRCSPTALSATAQTV